MFSSSTCLNASTSSILSASAPRVSLADLEKEHSELSLFDREIVERDLIGKPPNSMNDEKLPDDEAQTEALLQQLEHELDSLPKSDTALYHEALQRCPVFATRLKRAVLHAVGNDPVLAATRMARNWRERVKLFGTDVAFRGRLAMEALQPQDFETIRRGGLRVLSGKDENGRGILFSDRRRWTSDRESMMRICWYMIESAVLDDEKMQRNGMVVVSVACAGFKLEHFDRKVNTRLLTAFREYLPIRIVGIHMLMQSHMMKLALPFILWAMGPQLRARFRIHAGSFEEMMIDLDKYGINSKELPLEIGGSEVFRYDRWVATTSPLLQDPLEGTVGRGNSELSEQQTSDAPHQLIHTISLSRARAA